MRHQEIQPSKTSLIQINAFPSLGIASLPGMMTEQILAGVDPLLAIRYKIMIIPTATTAGGLASALFLYFNKAAIFFNHINNKKT